MEDLKPILWILLGLFLIWLLLGGVKRYEGTPADQGAFIAPTYNSDVGVIYSVPHNSTGFVAPTTWTRAETDYFTVLLPPGWHVENLNGVDSYVGEFTNGTLHFTFDYGKYSTHLVREGDERYTITYEKIDGKDAEFVRPKTALGTITGVFIDRLGDNLTLSATGLSTTNQDLLFNIARTIDFK